MPKPIRLIYAKTAASIRNNTLMKKKRMQRSLLHKAVRDSVRKELERIRSSIIRASYEGKGSIRDNLNYRDVSVATLVLSELCCKLQRYGYTFIKMNDSTFEIQW
jgi:hypothetical protein